jgi:hypothetical protein
MMIMKIHQRQPDKGVGRRLFMMAEQGVNGIDGFALVFMTIFDVGLAAALVMTGYDASAQFS